MKKLLLYISDGVGCRNFIYSDFLQNAAQNGFEVTILKNVDFDFDSQGCKVIAYPKLPVPGYVDILKSVKVEAEINLFAKKFNNELYKKCLLKSTPKRFKDKLKKKYIKYLVSVTDTEEKIQRLEKSMYRHAVKSPLFSLIVTVLL